MPAPGCCCRWEGVCVCDCVPVYMRVCVRVCVCACVCVWMPSAHRRRMSMQEAGGCFQFIFGYLQQCLN